MRSICRSQGLWKLSGTGSCLSSMLFKLSNIELNPLFSSISIVGMTTNYSKLFPQILLTSLSVRIPLSIPSRSFYLTWSLIFQFKFERYIISFSAYFILPLFYYSLSKICLAFVLVKFKIFAAFDQLMPNSSIKRCSSRLYVRKGVFL